MNRKHFLRSTATVMTASALGLPALEAAVGSPCDYIPIVDTHQHLWDIKRFNQGWSRPPLNRNFDESDYKEAIRGLNIIKAVYMEVAVPENKRYEEALYAIEMCRDQSNPTVAAVIAADPNSPDFKSYVSQFSDNSFIKGIRYFFKSPDEIARPLIIENIRFLGDINLSFDFSIPTTWLPQMAGLISICPETRFLLNHCGNVDPRAFFDEKDLKNEKPDHDRDKWINDMKVMAASHNVVCKISGVLTRAMNHELTAENLAPAINQCLDIYGPDRVMFASDWPVCLRKMELAGWANVLKEIVSDRPYGEQKKMFHDNAVNFYKI